MDGKKCLETVKIASYNINGINGRLTNLLRWLEVLPLPDGELLARELMNTTRFERRQLADDLFSLVAQYQHTAPRLLVRRYHVLNEIGHLIIYYSRDEPEENINRVTQLAAQIYAYKYQQKAVVVIAATDDLVQYKFGLFKSFEEPPSAEAIDWLENMIKQLGWFQNERRIEIHTTEFSE